MRSNIWLLSLSLAPLALSAPVYLERPDWVPVKPAPSPSSDIPALKFNPRSDRQIAKQQHPFVAGLDDTLQEPVPAPYPASHLDKPAAILASPGPIDTTTLSALTKAESNPQPTMPTDQELIDAQSIIELEVSRGQRPCAKVRESRDRLVIGLVATFLVIIILMELWDAVCRRATSVMINQQGGAIRLEEEEGEKASRRSHGPLSISAEDCEAISEKRTAIEL